MQDNTGLKHNNTNQFSNIPTSSAVTKLWPSFYFETDIYPIIQIFTEYAFKSKALDKNIRGWNPHMSKTYLQWHEREKKDTRTLMKATSILLLKPLKKSLMEENSYVQKLPTLHRLNFF